MRHQTVDRTGFTLIEIVMVVVVIGLMVAIAAPKIDVTGYKVNSAMQVMGATMLTAQRQALTQQHDVIVRFDSAQRRVRIHEDRNNNGAIDGVEHVRVVLLGESMVFGRGAAPAMAMGAGPIVITKTIDGVPALTFHRDGSASEVGGFYFTSIIAQNNNARPDDARAVRVERATGRSSWFRYRNGAWEQLF